MMSAACSLPLAAFHFMRPWAWALLLPLALLLLIAWRRGDLSRPWRQLIAPHLLPHLLEKPGDARSRLPTPLQLLGPLWFLSVVALAGPAWRQEPAPFGDRVAPMVVILRVTPSMMEGDLPPSRLERAILKLSTLLNHARKGGRTALIAYAGSAHIVVPLTSDAGIITTFAQALSPEVMPIEGDNPGAAFALGQHLLDNAGGGSFLWMTDDLTAQGRESWLNWRDNTTTPVAILPIAPSANPALEATAKQAHTRIIPLTADSGDLATITRWQRGQPGTTGEARWVDEGRWLIPLLLLLLLPLFRKGAKL